MYSLATGMRGAAPDDDAPGEAPGDGSEEVREQAASRATARSEEERQRTLVGAKPPGVSCVSLGMCIGCILGACVVSVMYGSGALISWRANAARVAAMKAVESGVLPEEPPTVPEERPSLPSGAFAR